MLKCINEFSSTFQEEFEDNKSQHHDLWLDKSYVNNFRSKSSSFPVYRIDVINKALLSLSNDNQFSKPTKLANHLKILVENLPDEDEERERLSNQIFSSNWLKEFINNNLSKEYPLSRFTVLVAIWIISVDCNHRVLDQLTGELIDRIYHEEANSNNEEELLQLTQVGSFWVTYHKKYKATLRQVNLSQIYDDNDNGEISSHDDNTSESLSSSPSSSSESSNSSVSLFHNNRHNLGKTSLNEDVKDDDNGRQETSSQVDLRFKLRQLIDEELLHGIKCIICSYEPSELFEPLNTNSCPKCANQKPVERCSISYRPLELVCFNSLIKFKPNISKLVLVSPNEWARYIIAPKLASLRIGLKLAKTEEDEQTFSNNFKHQQQEQQQQVGECVVVAENYERLTVIRGGDINQVRKKVDKKEDNEDESSSTPLSSSSSLSSSRSSLLVKEENQDSSSDEGEDEDENEEGEEEEEEEERKNKLDRRMKRRKSRRRKKKVTGNQRVDGDTYISILENYIKIRLKHSDNRIGSRIGRHTNSSSLSETIEMFKMVLSNNTTILPICMTDLLIMDTNHDNVDGGRMMFKLALVTSNNKLFESGSLWSCSNRSLISKVRLGCGSVFSSLELVRLGLQSGGGSNEFTCPLCDCQPLIRLRKLNEEL